MHKSDRYVKMILNRKIFEKLSMKFFFCEHESKQYTSNPPKNNKFKDDTSTLSVRVVHLKLNWRSQAVDQSG